MIGLCWPKSDQGQQQQQRPFYGPLSGTTRVNRYQKKHSPTHHPDHHPVFISFFHLPRSIASSEWPGLKLYLTVLVWMQGRWSSVWLLCQASAKQHGLSVSVTFGYQEGLMNPHSQAHSSFQSTNVSSTLEALAMMRCINLRFTLHYITLETT